MRSMTGFGVGEVTSPRGRLVVEARSVNHRFLDVRVKVPREMIDHQVYVEQMFRARLTRGRVDVTVHCDHCASATVTLDRAKAIAVMREFQAVADELGIPGPVPLSVLVGVPDLFLTTSDRDPEGTRATLRDGVERCVEDMDKMRLVEGQSLGRDLSRRLDITAGLLKVVASRADGMFDRHRTRFRERLGRLTAGLHVDAARVEQEVALAVDHADISEELTRLECHREQFAKLFEVAEPAGRRMDFLLQEMSREVNTIGSKASEAEVALAVVELKSEIERMREQVQNIE